MTTKGEKRKDNRTKHIKSPIRKQKVARGRLIWKSTTGTYNERLHDFFKYCLDITDGYSKKEMSFIIFGDKINLDKHIGAKGQLLDLKSEDILRLIKYTKYVEQMFSKFRKWLENEGLILESDKNASGEIIYYNIMQSATMQELERRRRKLEESIREIRVRETGIFNKGRAVRMKKIEAETERIKHRKRRDDKRDTGDYGGDGVY
jgi:hypothetical protein